MMKDVFKVLGVLFVICFFIYGGYWVTKHVSYAIFYEDMVQDTIKEMVKPEYLNDRT